ncbi:hypothetical protein EDB19DRAFT_1834311 [Suillus lakei]|nr:hypothetical protein EDB19DRAFT_1834311 [Suillus lakei]
MAAAPIDESADNEQLEFLSSESPVPSMISDRERVGQLSKADWLEEKLLEDGEEELDQLEAEPRPEEDHDSDQSIEFTDVDSVASASGPTFMFVNVDLASFSGSHKRKRDSPDLVSAATECLLGPSTNKYKYNKFVPQGRLTDEAIDWMLTGKKKKLSAKGKSMKPSVTVLPCQLTMLPVTKMKFKNQAQSAPHKKIVDEAGYEALLDAVKAKQAAKNIVVWLFTLKPAKDEQDWDTGDPDYVECPFNFDEEAGAASRTTNSLIATGRADMSAPPTTNHFTQKLKVPHPPLDAPISTFGTNLRQQGCWPGTRNQYLLSLPMVMLFLLVCLRIHMDHMDHCFQAHLISLVLRINFFIHPSICNHHTSADTHTHYLIIQLCKVMDNPK